MQCPCTMISNMPLKFKVSLVRTHNHAGAWDQLCIPENCSFHYEIWNSNFHEVCINNFGLIINKGHNSLPSELLLKLKTIKLDFQMLEKFRKILFLKISRISVSRPLLTSWLNSLFDFECSWEFIIWRKMFEIIACFQLQFAVKAVSKEIIFKNSLHLSALLESFIRKRWVTASVCWSNWHSLSLYSAKSKSFGVFLPAQK